MQQYNMSTRAGALPPARAVAFRWRMTEYPKRLPPILRRGIGAVAGFALLLTLPQYATSFPVDGDQTVLPAGSELNEDAVYVPREILRSEGRGDRTSYVVALGDLAFNSPSILGDVARRAGISC